MIVTEIRPQRRDTGKYNIFIDGEYAFALPPTDIAYFKIKEDHELKQETYDFIQENLIYIKAQDTALNYIGYKMRTEQQVREKLIEKEFSEKNIEKVIAFLQKYNYINDRTYAKSYIKQRQNSKPRSAFLLNRELKYKGVSEEVLQETFESVEIDEVEDALFWVEKKSRGVWPLDQKKEKQLIGFLQRKGYRYSIIKEAFAKMNE